MRSMGDSASPDNRTFLNYPTEEPALIERIYVTKGLVDDMHPLYDFSLSDEADLLFR